MAWTFKLLLTSGKNLHIGLMQIIHDSIPQFNPPGLADHIREHSAETISHARQLISEIEEGIRLLTFTILKKKYGESEQEWWREGVPQNIRGQAALRSETSEEGGDPDQYLNLIDYKNIAAQSKHWRDFEPHLTTNSSHRSKDEKLAWLSRLNTLRNRAFHPGRGRVTSDEIDFLEEIWAHVGDEASSLNGERGAYPGL